MSVLIRWTRSRDFLEVRLRVALPHFYRSLPKVRSLPLPSNPSRDGVKNHRSGRRRSPRPLRGRRSDAHSFGRIENPVRLDYYRGRRKAAVTSCVVLFSGGLDSTTALVWALARYDRVHALTFDYGQRHRVEVAPRPQGRPPARSRAHRPQGRPPADRRLGPDRLGHPTPPFRAAAESDPRPSRDLCPVPQRDLSGPGRRLGRGARSPGPRLRLSRRRFPRLSGHHVAFRPGHGEGHPRRHPGRFRRTEASGHRAAHRPGQGRHHPERSGPRGRFFLFRHMLRRGRATLRGLLLVPPPGPGLEGRRPRGPAPRPSPKGRATMSWTLKVRDKFSAAHYLKEYRGKCEKVHGHTFQVEVEIAVRRARPDRHRVRLHRDQEGPGRDASRPLPPQRDLPVQSVR